MSASGSGGTDAEPRWVHPRWIPRRGKGESTPPVRFVATFFVVRPGAGVAAARYEEAGDDRPSGLQTHHP